MYCPALLFGDGLGRRLPAIWNEVGQTRCQATSLRECLKPSFHLTFSALVTGGNANLNPPTLVIKKDLNCCRKTWDRSPQISFRMSKGLDNLSVNTKRTSNSSFCRFVVRNWCYVRLREPQALSGQRTWTVL